MDADVGGAPATVRLTFPPEPRLLGTIRLVVGVVAGSAQPTDTSLPVPLHRRLPKRGFRNTAFARRLNEVNLEKIQAAIDAGKLDAGATVDAEALVKAGVLRRAKDGVRLLGSGEIKAKVAFSVWGASKSAMQAVEKAGGSVTLLAPKRPTGEQPA